MSVPLVMQPNMQSCLASSATTPSWEVDVVILMLSLYLVVYSTYYYCNVYCYLHCAFDLYTFFISTLLIVYLYIFHIYAPYSELLPKTVPKLNDWECHCLNS